MEVIATLCLVVLLALFVSLIAALGVVIVWDTVCGILDGDIADILLGVMTLGAALLIVAAVLG